MCACECVYVCFCVYAYVCMCAYECVYVCGYVCIYVWIRRQFGGVSSVLSPCACVRGIKLMSAGVVAIAFAAEPCDQPHLTAFLGQFPDGPPTMFTTCQNYIVGMLDFSLDSPDLSPCSPLGPSVLPVIQPCTAKTLSLLPHHLPLPPQCGDGG